MQSEKKNMTKIKKRKKSEKHVKKRNNCECNFM